MLHQSGGVISEGVCVEENKNTHIHVVYKTHLDVGFTDFAKNIVKDYMDYYIPKAVSLAKQLRESGLEERFIWTTGSWIIYEYLEKAEPQARKLMEEAINAGNIRWHAMPFTTHTEYMDASLFKYGLGLSKRLDERFAIKTIAAKMSDVPGHTRAIIPLMEEAGIKVLHIGCNPALTPPLLPPVFKWKDHNNSELLVMYQTGYGSYMKVEGIKHALLFEHTNDNLGPQTMNEVLEGYKRIRKQYEGAKVFASDLSSFGTELIKIANNLPVIDKEIGDTWIHGVGTDPQKTSQYRVLQRARREWYDKEDKIAKKFKNYDAEIELFNRSLIMVPEHTWGMDIKTHLKDTIHYAREDFNKVRGEDNFSKVEASWKEQREYLTSAVTAIKNTPLYASVEAELQETLPKRPGLEEYLEIRDMDHIFHTDGYNIAFNRNGVLYNLEDTIHNRVIFDEKHMGGQMSFQAFTDKDYERFHKQYLTDHAKWATDDNGKPGLNKANHYVETFTPVLKKLWKRLSTGGYLLNLEFEETTCRQYGCPLEIYMEWEFNNKERKIEIKLLWFQKSASRLPEAYWLSFNPITENSNNWRLMKMGQEISPLDVVENGSKKLHCIDDKVINVGLNQSIAIYSKDTPLIAPGNPSLLDFNNKQPQLEEGMTFMLLNNVWGTNFPMWYEDDAVFRFEITY